MKTVATLLSEFSRFHWCVMYVSKNKIFFVTIPEYKFTSLLTSARLMVWFLEIYSEGGSDGQEKRGDGDDDGDDGGAERNNGSDRRSCLGLAFPILVYSPGSSSSIPLTSLITFLFPRPITRSSLSHF
ncbi:hypothetical protein E2C01_083371 [Portunus trituberculatus]|uniref:Uncharacterized protein n=1 Tax=Portunus trituberculatus TaxID=210409 RepID=A0A5B7J3B2_PORTR|nr:hypothetical protein [Portunus trituberculatus]